MANQVMSVQPQELNEEKTNKDECCAICFCDFKENVNRQVVELTCSNKIFHEDCMREWVEKYDYCPLTKKPICWSIDIEYNFYIDT